MDLELKLVSTGEETARLTVDGPSDAVAFVFTMIIANCDDPEAATEAVEDQIEEQAGGLDIGPGS